MQMDRIQGDTSAACTEAHRAVLPLAKSLQRRKRLQWSVETRHFLRQTG